jgi:hypothetical protein
MAMIKLRLDVDYPFPSRFKSFLFTALNQKNSKDYLRNSKIIAKMINESKKEVMAYWFFTPQTIPDGELLHLLSPEKHEVALHVANNPYDELDRLEKATNRKIRYYTVHGTARLLARLMWRRKIWEDRANIPKTFPLQSFYQYPTLGFDLVCHNKSIPEAVKTAEESIAKGDVLHIHPEWLFERGAINHRGPFYEPLKQILQVDDEISTLIVRKKLFVKIAGQPETREYERDFAPTEGFIRKLSERSIDVFTFLERRWCSATPIAPRTWWKTEDNIALLEVTTYPAWLEQIGKKTRNMVRKAEKSGIRVEIVKPSASLVEGIWEIFNETPIRQERAFPHYGQSKESVRSLVANSQDTFIAAWLQNELAGFIQMVQGDNIAIISQILSLQKHSDKAVNNALIAKAVEFCASKGEKWLMYARMGNHPSLDTFKENNGFKKFEISRYYVPVTVKGRIAIRLGLHKNAKDVLPQWLKHRVIPIYNWISRAKIRLKH